MIGEPVEARRHAAVLSTRGGGRLLLVWALLLLVFVPLVRGEDLPPQGDEVLRSILEQPEYQPRGGEPSMLTRLKQAALMKAGQVLERIGDAIDALLESAAPAADSLRPLFDAMARFFRVLVFLLYYVCLPLALLYLLYRCCRLYAVRVRPRGGDEEGDAVVRKAASRSRRSPWDLLRSGEYLQALAELHALLREDICRRHQLSSSATDREIARVLPEDESSKALFHEAAALFERVVFGRRALDPEALGELLGRYRVMLEEQQ